MDQDNFAQETRPKKRKLLDIDTDQIVNSIDGDIQWNQFFRKAFQSDPKLEYTENHSYSHSSENGIDFEATEKEQQRYIAFLSDIPKIYDKLKYWPPSTKQKTLILAIAAYVSQNEKKFIQMNAQGVYRSFIEMAEESKCAGLVKVRYMDLLCTVFEHDAGLKWSLETNHWTGIYDMVVECQKEGCDIAEKVHGILSKFLQKTSRYAPKVCIHVIKQMIQNLIAVAHKNFPKTKKQPVELINPEDYKNLTSSVSCLVEVLEILLASPSTDLLKYFVKLQVREASDTLAMLSNDGLFSLQVNRINIILSFYEMTEFFDGIKVINHDPIVLSGFLRIIEREMKKHHFKTIFELYYYALKYWKTISRKMPQYFFKEKPVDIEDELMNFQVEPLVIIAEKLLGVPQTSEEVLRNCYLTDILNMYSADSLQLGYEMREHINKESLEIEITALKCLIKSKPMYSRQNVALVFQALTYSLRDFIKYVNKNPDKGEFELDQALAETMFDAMLVYLENFDLSWRESIGSIELTNLVYDFLFSSSRWLPEVVLKALKALNITISKHMSPNMALLVDTTKHSSLEDLGSMLFNKCFNNDSEVRNAALTVICTLCQKVNKGFNSFKKILEEYLTKDLILTMSMTDFDKEVRATALKCLQEIIEMEELGENLLNTDFIDKILQLVSREVEPMVIREAITLIGQIYQNECNSDIVNLKIYNVMVKVALREKDVDVQEHAVKFWEKVTQKHLEEQGMLDDVFPAVTFSKEQKKIIRLDDKEIRKRLFQALDSMSKSGCFSVFQRMLENENAPKKVLGTTVALITKLLRLLQKYEVTPEFILFNQTYPNLWSVHSVPANGASSPSSMNEYEDMQEIIEATVMEMLNDSSQLGNKTFNQCETLDLLIDRNSEYPLSHITTVDFIDFIYRKWPCFTT